MDLERLRRLVSIRRHVPNDRLPEYLELWTALRTAVRAHGAHAWHFARAGEPELFIEFLEFGSDSDVRADETVVQGIQALHDRFGDPYPPPMTLEEWVELPPLPEGQ